MISNTLKFKCYEALRRLFVLKVGSYFSGSCDSNQLENRVKETFTNIDFVEATIKSSLRLNLNSII